MEQIIRDAQIKLLKAFAGAAATFALSGGTALELFYLKHRFSRDLDFFSPEYQTEEIDALAQKFSETINSPVKFESELIASNKARVRFYTVKIKGAEVPLKIDFIEDVFFKNPTISKFNGVPVYSTKNIYSQKITTRKEVRDVVDIYYLSKKIEPLHKFLKTLDRQYQRGVIQWYRNYSRQDVKLGVFDLALYDRNFDVSELISYLDSEIKEFMGKELK